jgi:hypothetical protein
VAETDSASDDRQPTPIVDIDLSDSSAPELQTQSSSARSGGPGRLSGVTVIQVSAGSKFCENVTFDTPFEFTPLVFASLKAIHARDTFLFAKAIVSILETTANATTLCIDYIANWPRNEEPHAVELAWLATIPAQNTGVADFREHRPVFLDRVCKQIHFRPSLNSSTPLAVFHTVRWRVPSSAGNTVASWIQDRHSGGFKLCITETNPASAGLPADGWSQVAWARVNGDGGSVGARVRGRAPACSEVNLDGASRRTVVVSAGYDGPSHESEGAAVAWVERQEDRLFVACVQRLDADAEDEVVDVDIVWQATSATPILL